MYIYRLVPIRLYQKFCPFVAVARMLDSPLAIVYYVVYFRFCGWRHLFTNDWRVALYGCRVAENFHRIHQGAPYCLTLSL